MILTAEQINIIKAFISKRGFTYPDVQLEIIDHVASRVEELMAESPKLSLDEAIGITHAEFGVMGFSVFEDSMIVSLQKKFFKHFVTILFSYFNWKYLPLIAASVYLIYRTYVAVNNPQYFVVAGFIVLLLILLVTGIRYETRYKKYSKMLTMRMGNSYMVICSVIFNIWNIFGNQFKIYQNVSINTSGIVFSLLAVLVILLLITVDRLRQITIKECEELDGKYQLLSSL
jgi:hypothetical protein